MWTPDCLGVGLLGVGVGVGLDLLSATFPGFSWHFNRAWLHCRWCRACPCPQQRPPSTPAYSGLLHEPPPRPTECCKVGSTCRGSGRKTSGQGAYSAVCSNFFVAVLAGPAGHSDQHAGSHLLLLAWLGVISPRGVRAARHCSDFSGSSAKSCLPVGKSPTGGGQTLIN